MEDEKRSVTAIFWLLLGLAFSTLTISVGATWAFLAWTGVLHSGRLWPAFLLFGLGVLGALGCFAGINVWLLRQARSLPSPATDR